MATLYPFSHRTAERLAAAVIAELYRKRWQVELFFKARREVAHVTV